MNLLLFCAILGQTQKPIAQEIAVKWLQRKISWHRMEWKNSCWSGAEWHAPCLVPYFPEETKLEIHMVWVNWFFCNTIPVNLWSENQKYVEVSCPITITFTEKRIKYHLKVLLTFLVSEFVFLLIYVPVKSIQLKSMFERLFSGLAYSIKMYARQQICFLDYFCLNFK